MIHRSSRSRTSEAASFTSHHVRECTGMAVCGVRTDHGRSSSFAWERCPLNMTLKKG
jgi:hypothetical protein